MGKNSCRNDLLFAAHKFSNKASGARDGFDEYIKYGFQSSGQTEYFSSDTMDGTIAYRSSHDR